MDLNAIMEEIELKLAGVDNGKLRVTKWGEKPNPPGAMVLLPESLAVLTHQRGIKRINDLVVLVTVGRANSRSALKSILSYASDTGDKSVPAVLDPAAWETCADVTLTSTTFDTVTIIGAEGVYLAALFHLDVTGA